MPDCHNPIAQMLLTFDAPEEPQRTALITLCSTVMETRRNITDVLTRLAAMEGRTPHE